MLRKALAAASRRTAVGHFHATVVGAVLVGAALVVAVERSAKSRTAEGSQPAGGGNLSGGILVGGICAAVIALQYAVAATEALSHCGPKLNVQRKVQHIASGLAIAALFRTLPLLISQLALGAAVAAFSLFHLARRLPEVNRQFLALFGPMLKDEERSASRPPAALHFLLGCLLCVLAFPRQLATFCILSATVADPIAAVGGLLLGGPRLLGRKTLGGSAACCLAGAAVAAGVLLCGGGGPPVQQGPPLGVGPYAWACLACGLAAAVGELLGCLWWCLDDNLTTSFGAGVLLCASQRVIGAVGADGQHAAALASLLH